VEAVDRAAIGVVAAHLRQAPPVADDAAWGLLVEVVGDGDGPLEELAAALTRFSGTARSTAVADDAASRARLWRWREAVPEAMASLGVVHKADVTLPHGALADFADAVGPAVGAVAPVATVVLYGHVGDGNLHVNVVGPEPADDAPVDAVLALVRRFDGSVSAEHGIGSSKRQWLVAQRGEDAVAAMRAIKRGLDPDSVINPGVLLP
jgi:FAD/FMN-containing dehydrogenase